MAVPGHAFRRHPQAKPGADKLRRLLSMSEHMADRIYTGRGSAMIEQACIEVEFGETHHVLQECLDFSFASAKRDG
jgi:hypothetical protein